MNDVIGLDIGGTKITGIVFNGKRILRQLTIITPKNLFDFERNILKIVDFLSAKEKTVAIGLGIAGLVDAEKGIVKYSPNIKFVKNLKLVKLFKLNKINNVKIDNDANCFARAEMLLGQGKKFKNFLALTLGTGIGGGIIINRQLYRGQNNSGAELGHMVAGDDFLEKYFQRLRDKKDYNTAGKLLGKGLASFANIFAPEAIIVGGSYGINESKKYLPTAQAQMRQFLFDNSNEPKIIISKLKNAGALGAALLLKNLKNKNV